MFLHIPDGAIFFPLHNMFFLFFLFLTKQALVQSFYGKKSVNLPLIATEGFSMVLDSAMYPY